FALCALDIVASSRVSAALSKQTRAGVPPCGSRVRGCACEGPLTAGKRSGPRVPCRGRRSMGLCKQMLRKVGTWAVLGGLGAGGVWLAGAARGQGPAPSAALDAQKKSKIYTNKNLFHLPVQIDQRTRGNLREVCLYVKAGSGDWVRQDTGQ